MGDVSEGDVRRDIQIRETVKAHFEKERQLFSARDQNPFIVFIDEGDNLEALKKKPIQGRDYDQDDEKGIYARIFEEEYENQQRICQYNFYLA